MSRPSYERSTHRLAQEHQRPCPTCGKRVRDIFIDTWLGQSLGDFVRGDSEAPTFRARAVAGPCGHPLSEPLVLGSLGGGSQPALPPAQHALPEAT